MSATHNSLVPVDSGLGGLAVAGWPDRYHEHYAARLVASVERVTSRLEQVCSEPVAAQIRRCRDWFAALPRSVAEDLVCHPLFNYYWLELTKVFIARDAAAIDTWALHLPRFLISEATIPHATRSSAWTVPCQADGVLKLPNNRDDLMVDTTEAHVTLVLDDHGAGWYADGRVHLPPAFVAGHGPDTLGAVKRLPKARARTFDVVVDAGDAWTSRLLSSINERSGIPGYPKLDLAPMVLLDSTLPDQIDASLQFIRHVWPEASEEIRRYLRLVIPYTSSFHSSFTESCTMGAVYLSEAIRPFSSLEYTAEHLLHEVSHLRLTLLQELELLVEADPDATFNPPWRNDPRPLSGTLQGIFAFARMAAFHRRAFVTTGAALHRERHAELQRQLVAAMTEVTQERSVRLTPSGREWWSGLHVEATATLDDL